MDPRRRSPRAFAASLLAAAVAACASDAAPPPPAAAPPPELAPADVVATEAQRGSLSEAPLGCRPSAVAATVAKELGAEGVDGEALRNRVSWGVPTMFDTPWISDDKDERASVRVRPLAAPGVAACVRDALALGPLEALGTLSSLRVHDGGADSLTRLSYAPPTYDVEAPHALLAALRGLLSRPNGVAGAPKSAEWAPALADALAATEAACPPEVRAPLARMVLALAEASTVRELALAEAGGPAAFAELYRALLGDGATYPIGTFTQAMMAPVDALSTMKERAPLVDGRALAAMGMAVSDAALALGRALAAAPPFEAPRVELKTAHGRVLLNLDARDDRYGDLSDVALLVDLGGSDRYAGRVAAVVHPWSSASVLVDVRGDDRYGPDMPDLRGAEAGDAFSVVHAMTQGFAVLGAAALVDASGNDSYRATMHAQGSSILGTGALFDLAGDDRYGASGLAQGEAYAGAALLDDAEGDDEYTLAIGGQGMGRPKGAAALVDRGGADDYMALFVPHAPGLPGPGGPRLIAASSGYADGDKNDHMLSFAQGVGAGFRPEWLGPLGDGMVWRGGFGALVDLGDGKDVHRADCLAMGQGFAYGMGLSSDGGGDDRYAAFWWAFGSGTHMGTGVMLEEGGDDEYVVTRASGTLGHDTGVSWLYDASGDDRYEGAHGFGRSLDGGLAFFVDGAGKDRYAPLEADRANANIQAFGFIQNPRMALPRVAVFLDLGGATDEYLTARPEIVNGGRWRLAPAGEAADPTKHVALGVDR